ncbi:hypothetical protein ACFQU3_21890 [Terrabacter sp. GCM10028922]|uniref:hypothetical protein n=1 Tax=Terrabacter sp. GCM10028922 TaxID=3273428 RepID=UPI00360AF196
MSTAPTRSPARSSAGRSARGSAADVVPRNDTVHRVGRGAPVGVIVALAVVLGIVLTAFALPAANSAPRDVPIGVAGPAAASAQVTAALNGRAPGAFEVNAFADEAALTSAIRDRDVYGGIVVTVTGPKVLTAPAGSPAVAQLLTNLATSLSQQTGRQVPVTEVVPLPAKDARGAGLSSALLPLIIGSVAPVIAMVRLVRGRWSRLAGVLTASVVIGATLAGLLHWYGVFTAGWGLDAAAMAAVLAAMSTALLGLHAVGRWAGLGLGVATFMLLGNPLSGLATAREFLPELWSSLGSWLPPGAAGQLLRSSAYFDGAGATHGLIVLGSWFLVGLLLIAVAPRSRASDVPAPALA